MHRITFLRILQVWIVLGMLGNALMGEVREEQGGWELAQKSERGAGAMVGRNCGRRWGRISRRASWQVALLRSILLLTLWEVIGEVGPGWIAVLPWMIWLIPDHRGVMGRVRRLLWEVQRIILIGYLGLGVWHLLGSEIETALNGGSWLGMGCIWCGSEEAQVRVEQLGDGSYQASLCGHFTIQVDGEPSLR